MGIWPLRETRAAAKPFWESRRITAGAALSPPGERADVSIGAVGFFGHG